MIKQTAICLLMATVLGGCSKETPTVVLDGWWNADYAKNNCDAAKQWYKHNAALIGRGGCNKVTSCKVMMPRVEACRFDGTGGERAFETKVATAFASNPACAGVSVVKFSGPKHVTKAAAEASQRQHWQLMFDYIPGSKQQGWSIIRLGKNHSFAKGSDNAEDIAGKVCAIVTNVGAQVRN